MKLPMPNSRHQQRVQLRPRRGVKSVRSTTSTAASHHEAMQDGHQLRHVGHLDPPRQHRTDAATDGNTGHDPAVIGDLRRGRR